MQTGTRKQDSVQRKVHCGSPDSTLILSTARRPSTKGQSSDTSSSKTEPTNRHTANEACLVAPPRARVPRSPETELKDASRGPMPSSTSPVTAVARILCSCCAFCARSRTVAATGATARRANWEARLGTEKSSLREPRLDANPLYCPSTKYERSKFRLEQLKNETHEQTHSK